jgi:hypothetical protein
MGNLKQHAVTLEVVEGEESMEHGPVDVLVVAFGEPRFDGSVLAELEGLAKAGTIRVLDAMVLLKLDDNTAATLDIEDIDDDEKSALGFIETGTRGLFDADDAAALLEALAPGSAVVALAIEQTWAVGLENAIIQAGAEVALHERIPAVEVDAAFAMLANAEQ